MKLAILMDNPKSWYYPFALELQVALEECGHTVVFVERLEDIPEGDVAFFLSVEQLVKKDIRARNKHNIVVHSSDLPLGKGWSPLTWQILEGKSEIVNTLFEAADKVDAGEIYLQETMRFEGHELLPELHEAQRKGINRLILQFVDRYPNVEGKEQEGTESIYPRRKPEDSELDVNKTIAEQFNALRVADNEKYPAYFRHRGYRYIVKIEKADI